MTGFWDFSNGPLWVAVFLRTSAFLWLLPIFPPRLPQIKVALSFFLSLILTSTLTTASPAPNLEINITFLILCFQEMAMGLVLGFWAVMLADALRMVGMLLSHLMGLEMAQTLAPGSMESSPVLAHFCYSVGFLLFLLGDFHYFVLEALVASFDVLPLGSLHLHPSLADGLLDHWVLFFRLSILVVTPMFLLMLGLAVEMAILARMVPQLNIFLLEYPVRLGATLIFLAWFLPSLIHGFYQLFDFLRETMIFFLS